MHYTYAIEVRFNSVKLEKKIKGETWSCWWKYSEHPYNYRCNTCEDKEAYNVCFKVTQPIQPMIVWNFAMQTDLPPN